MKNLPLVSIITPTYNHEKFIADCIISVQTQTYTNWEMIIIDDGSFDETYSIAMGFTSDHRIRVIRQDNIGVFRLAETYNLALDNSKGDYIAILEGDDLWENDKLQLQVKALEENKNFVLSWTKGRAINENNTKTLAINPPEEFMRSKELFSNKPIGAILEILYQKDFINALTIVLRKSSLLKIGGFIQERRMPFVDYTTLLEMAIIGEFHYEDKILGAWRSYPNQVTKVYAIDIYTGLKKFIIGHYDNLPSEIKQKLQIKRGDLISHWNKQVLISYARSGRYKLLKKNYSEARKDYLTAIFYRGPSSLIWRIKASIGLLFSIFHLNIEWLAKITGRVSYSASK